MRRSGSKSLFQRVVEKALPNALLGRISPNYVYPSANIQKSIDEDSEPQGAVTPYYTPYTSIITLQSYPDLDDGYPKRRTYHSEITVKPHRRRANKLSIQTNHTAIESPGNTVGQTKRLNLDHFIRRIENWTPPSPREVLARRLFHEVQRATNTHPSSVPRQPSAGGYLVHRRVKTERI